MGILNQVKLSRRNIFRLVALVLLCLAVSAPAATQTPRTPKRVLVLYWDNKDFPGNVRFDESFRTQLDLVSRDVEYYPEYMETTRFPGADQAFFHDYLKQKY